jgi:hypothetical protein
LADNPLLPMTMDQPSDVDYTPDNPQLVDSQQEIQSLGISEEDQNRLVETITAYRTQWAQDRLLRIPIWMKNILMYRGKQVLGWDPAQQTYFDALAWYRQSGNQQDGDDTYLEKYINNITQMLGTAFVGTMSRGVPPTVVRPENAEILADVTTAKAAQEAISIIERMNKIRQMVRIENTFLYLQGVYFKYTRTVIDGNWAGYDEEEEFGEIAIEKPDRLHCSQCGKDTPLNDTQSPDNDGTERQCDGCQAPLGAADFYPGEQPSMEMSVTGKKKIPRAMVRWSVHGPMEVDADPEAKAICDTALLNLDMEIDIGTARKTFPKIAAEITEGTQADTTPNSSYERLRRNEMYSQGYAYTSDTFQQRVTFSQCWMQPDAYYRLGEETKGEGGQTFAERMLEKFPDGLKISLFGKKVVDIRPAILQKQWSCCLLHENCGLYPPSIADNVVPFNERFNDTMNIIDDYFERCATGMTLADEAKLDRRNMSGKSMLPGVINFLRTQGEGQQQPLSNAIMQLSFKLDQNIISYPGMLMNFCELISGVTPQTFGAGTQEDVDTWRGQKQMLDQAMTRLNIFWENLKEEHAAASQNAIECLQEAFQEGLIRELYDVIESNGSEFRNNYVNLDKMNGRIRVYPDIDQGLPQSPEQIRETFGSMMEQVGKGNPIAQAIFDVLPNQETALAVLGTPDMVLPGAAQRSRTLQHINVLLEQPWAQAVGQDGQPVQDLPVKPQKNVDDFVVLKETMKLFRQENFDFERTNPDGWARLDAYYELAEQLELAQAVEDAQRKSKVMQAGGPQQQPDPTIQAAKQELLKVAVGEVDRLAQISQMPPLGKSQSMSAQVSAGKELIDTALKAVQ